MIKSTIIVVLFFIYVRKMRSCNPVPPVIQRLGVIKETSCDILVLASTNKL